MANKAYLRMLHACPDAPAVDVYLDDDIVVENLEYGKFTSYFTVDPGRYNLLIYPTGTSENAIIKEVITIDNNIINTVAVIGLPTSPKLLKINEPKQDITNGKAALRFVNLSYNSSPVDVILPNGKKLFSNVDYEQIEDYIELAEDKYSIKIVDSATSKDLLYVPNINLKSSRFYTIYLIGLADEQPYLQVVIPLDGNSYLMENYA